MIPLYTDRNCILYSIYICIYPSVSFQPTKSLKTPLPLQLEGSLNSSQPKVKSLRLQPLKVPVGNQQASEIQQNLSMPEKEKFQLEKKMIFSEEKKEVNTLFEDGTKITQLIRVGSFYILLAIACIMCMVLSDINYGSLICETNAFIFMNKNVFFQPQNEMLY